MHYQQEFHVFHSKSNVDLFPFQFGRESCPPLQAFGPTTVNNYLFHYILEGKGVFYLTEDNRQAELIAGQGFLVPPHTICSWQADNDNPWTYTWIEFNGLKARHFVEAIGLSNHNLIYYPKLAGGNSRIIRHFQTIVEHYHQSDAFIIGHLYLLLDALADNSQYYTPQPENDITNFYIREAIQYIQAHYHEQITIEEIAGRCNLNRSHFSRLFRNEMSLSPSQFLLQYRLKMASELLVTTNKNIHLISEEVGFNSPFNFATSFKKYFGVTPSQWRHRK